MSGVSQQAGDSFFLRVPLSPDVVEKMPTMLLLSSFLIFSLLGLTSAGQESIQFLKLDENITRPWSLPDLPIAVLVSDAELPAVSSSVLTAESWLRTNVLARFPSTRITTIVVGNTLLNNHQKINNLQSLVFLSLKNLFHSLTRWGLEKDIKVTALFSDDCFHLNAETSDGKLRLVLQFIQNTNSTITLKLPPDVSPLSDEALTLLSSRLESMEKLGFLGFRKVNAMVESPKETKPIGRKLSFVAANLGDEYPQMAEPPLPSSGYSVPSNIARRSQPPQSQIASPPPLSFPEAPELPPFVVPASPPVGFTLPPCNPNSNAGAPIPQTGSVQKLWCVAKPSVPAEILQQAMDYACGDGGAECKEISPDGNCYYPDTLFAHASYAFNSYWQKNKRNGGTCNFGGTAMIINSDPSFLHCRFVLS